MDLSHLKTFVLFQYDLGSNDFQISQMVFDFVVNNKIYLIKTESEKFILKYNESLNDFYGISDSVEKLETISKVTNLLVESQFPVENIVSNKSGNFVIPYLEGSIRIFRFIEGRQYSRNERSDKVSLIHFSKRLHTFPIDILINKMPNVYSHLVAPYALESVIDKFDYILDNLIYSSEEKWISFASNFEKVSKSLDYYVKWNNQFEKSLIHCDLHPRNVIFGENNGIHVIDLDYLRLGNPYVCLGFSLTRTSFFEENVKNEESILENLEVFENVYSRRESNGFAKDLLNGAIYIEIEKIFRNLYRYFVTGKYKKFAEDVLVVHYNYFTMLENLKLRLGF